MELMSGDTVINKNVSSNILRSKFCVCPVCGNIIRSTGDAVISCCGITLPPLEAEEVDEAHEITIERVEDEYFITVNPACKNTAAELSAYCWDKNAHNVPQDKNNHLMDAMRYAFYDVKKGNQEKITHYSSGMKGGWNG
jgi:hypothetical protein